MDLIAPYASCKFIIESDTGQNNYPPIDRLPRSVYNVTVESFTDGFALARANCHRALIFPPDAEIADRRHTVFCLAFSWRLFL